MRDSLSRLVHATHACRFGLADFPLGECLWPRWRKSTDELHSKVLYLILGREFQNGCNNTKVVEIKLQSRAVDLQQR